MNRQSGSDTNNEQIDTGNTTVENFPDEIGSDGNGENVCDENSAGVSVDEEVDAEEESKDDADNASQSQICGENGDLRKLADSSTRPCPNATVQYMLDNGQIKKAQVLSTQPKRTGKWKGWINVKVVGENEPSSVNWEDVVWWRKVEDVAQVLVLSATEECHQDIIDAKEREMQNLEENSVFEWVKDEGQKAVSCKWVMEEKRKSDGSKRLKGRLVARGFEENLADKKIDSPTCSRQALRLVFVAASSMDWEVHSLDISAAFLQGNTIQREIYVRPPPDICEEGKLWRLKRCLYGLNDAPREWYNRVKDELEKLGGKVGLYDQSMFMWHENMSLVGLIVTHVDDFVYCGTIRWHEVVIGNIVKTFKISKMEKKSFRYVGLDVEQNGNEIFVNQQAYIEELKELEIEPKRKSQLDEKLTEEEKKQLRSVCGQLLWATSQTRPDTAFESCRVSNYGNEATVRSLVDANKAIKKLKSVHLRLVFPGLGDPNKMKVVTFGDATHASLPNGASQGAVIVFLSGNNRVAPITWKSKKLERVTKSPLASEVSALADSADSAHLVASMVKELFALHKLPDIECFTDSKSLEQHLDSTKVIQDPRLRVDIARLREMVKLGEITVKWISGDRQLADCLTKKGASIDRLVNVLVNGAF